MFYKEKIDIAYKALENEDIDMWIVAGQESATASEPVLDIICDSEFIGCTALCFEKSHRCFVVCTPIDANGYEITNTFDEVIPFKTNFVDGLRDAIKDRNPKTIALDFSINNPSADGLTSGMYDLVSKAIKDSNVDAKIISAENIVTWVRGIKTEDELRKIKKACEETEVIFNDAKKIIKAGMNCKDVYAWFQNEVERKGYGYSWPKSANPGVFSGDGCPGGHMGAPDWIIKKGDLVNIDFGITIDGYSSDIQRMYYMLKDDEEAAPKDLVSSFNVVRDAIDMAAKALKSGTLGIDIDAVARDYIVSKGYPSWNAALGHELGRVAHDGGPLLAPARPRYNRDELIRTPLKENMVFTLEPGIPTRAGRIGIEEDVVVTQDGAKFIVAPQRELYLIK